MSLPPLQQVPHLERLLAPDEEIIYTAKLHPLYGWPWLVGALLLLICGYWVRPLWLPTAGLGIIYFFALKNFEGAITTRRLLLRYGRFGVATEGIMGEKIAEWRVSQTLLQRLLHAGDVSITVKEGSQLRPLLLPWLWHPFTFIEALETLQIPPKV